MNLPRTPISCLRAVSTALMCSVAICQVLSPSWAGEEPATLVIRGSSTLLPIVKVWADDFAQQPGTPAFDIAATGSSEGIADLLEGRADISMASRPLKPNELSVASEKGLTIRETVAARMGIAVIVSQDNPVRSVTIGQAAKIFSGEIENWRAVGGPDQPVIVVRKDSGWSPDFFRRRIMGNRDFVEDAVIVDSKEGVVAEVSDRPWSVGVTGLPEAIPALNRIGLLRLESEESELDSTFALSRPLFLFTVEDAPKIEKFLDFVLLDEAQESIVDTGFYPAYQSDVFSKE